MAPRFRSRRSNGTGDEDASPLRHRTVSFVLLPLCFPCYHYMNSEFHLFIVHFWFEPKSCWLYKYRIYFLLQAWRSISSLTSPVDSLATNSVVSSKILQNGGDDGNFKQEFRKLKLPRRSVNTVLQSGNCEAQRTSITKLRCVVKKFCKTKRFKRALKVRN